MKHLIIGIGEIGTAVWHNLLNVKNCEVSTVDKLDEPIDKQFEVLHICIPYSKGFVQIVKNYQEQYKPKCTIIYSTVPVGTTKKIDGAVHSPVEGRHPKLDYGVRAFKRWIGYNDLKIAIIAESIWEDITDCQLVPDSNYTEFLKLTSTSKYGINIVWAEYMAKTAKKLGMDYQLVKDWDKDYNDLYRRMKMPRFKKYILDPPKGKIGGHCVVNNAIILDKQFPSEMLKMIKAME